jgi:hypothetical protein
MEEIIKQYLVGFDEINQMISTSYRLAVTELDDVQDQVAQIIDDLLSMLILAYNAGMDATAQNLAADLSVDLDALEDALYTSIDGKTFEQRVQEYVLAQDMAGLSVVAASEYHRLYNAGAYDGAQQFVRTQGLGITKRWVTVRDDRVRETHRYLEGMSVDVDEEFYTSDGDHAPYPGAFRKAKNNVGCRCIVIYDPEEA